MDNTDNLQMDQLRKKLIREQRSLLIKKFLYNPGLVIGGIIILFLVVITVSAPVLTSYDPYEMQVSNRLQEPGEKNLLGTDEFGRDLMTRIFYGARVSMSVGLSVAAFSSFIGLIIGVYSAYYRSLDNILMRICDGLTAIPGILLAIALMAALGPSMWNVVIALTIVYAPSVARIVRSSALVVKEQAYIEAEYIQGAKDTRIIWLSIIPNVVSPLLVQATYVFASAILSEAALSFLGAGVPAPQPSWGNILQASKLVINKAWWMAIYPGIILIMSVLSLNLVGDGLRDFLDPRATVKKR